MLRPDSDVSPVLPRRDFHDVAITRDARCFGKGLDFASGTDTDDAPESAGGLRRGPSWGKRWQDRDPWQRRKDA
jgi:hypothetical protein